MRFLIGGQLGDKHVVDEILELRERGRCRFRYQPGCLKRATQIMLATPPWLGGEHTNDNATSVCRPCAEAHQVQCDLALAVFGGK